MPRGPRFVFENAFYHVFNRGLNKEKIFKSEADYRFFINKLLKLKEKYDLSLYAVCLMPNHFHLSIQTRKNTISQIMSSLATSYSMYFNRTYSHFGPIFQNRYKSILIENGGYFLSLSRYIYLNPVKDGLVVDPLDYPYSTFGEAIGKTSPRLLDGDVVKLIGETKHSQEEYAKFVYAGIGENLTEIDQLFNKEEAVYGSNAFILRAQRKYVKRNYT